MLIRVATNLLCSTQNMLTCLLLAVQLASSKPDPSLGKLVDQFKHSELFTDQIEVAK